MKYHFTLAVMAIKKKTENTNVAEDIGEIGTLIHC